MITWYYIQLGLLSYRDETFGEYTESVGTLGILITLLNRNGNRGIENYYILKLYEYLDGKNRSKTNS